MGGVSKTHFSQNSVATCLRGAFWINFGSQNGALWEPFGSRVGAMLRLFRTCFWNAKFKLISDTFRIRF